MNTINVITELFQQDILSLIMGIFIVLAGMIAIVDIIEKISKIIGHPVRWLRAKETDHQLLLETMQNLSALHDKQKEDTKQSIRHDEIIRNDLHSLATTVNEIADRINIMQNRIDSTEMAKLKDKILSYYRKYKDVDEWEKFESDVFWGLYDSYIAHGGNSFVKDEIEAVMRNLNVRH